MWPETEPVDIFGSRDHVDTGEQIVEIVGFIQ